MAQTLISSPDTNCGKSLLPDQPDSVRCKQDSPISTLFSAPDTDVPSKESLKHDSTIPKTGRKSVEHGHDFMFPISSPNLDGQLPTGDATQENVKPDNHKILVSRSPSPDNQVQPTPSTVVTSPNQSAASVTTSVKRPRHKPGERRELLIQAVQDVLTLHISMRRAAQKHNLAKSSLCDFVRKNGIVLPNLRLKTYQNIQNASGTDGNKKTLSSFGFANRPSSSSCKRAAVSTSDGINNLIDKHSSPAKLPCSVNRKYGVNRQKPSSRTSSRSGSRVSESPIGNDLLMANMGPETSADISHHDSVRYDGLNHHIGSDSSFADATLSVSRLMHPSTGPGLSTPKYSSSPCVLPKTVRIESPWHNAAGLPTQVPMRSWSALGCSQQNSLNSSLSSNCLNSDISDEHNQTENMQSLHANSHSMDGLISNTHENSISGHNQTFDVTDVMEPTDLSCDATSSTNGINDSESYFTSANHISCLDDPNDLVFSSNNRDGSSNPQTPLDFDRRHNFTEDSIHNPIITNHLINGFNGNLDPENLVLSRPSSTSHPHSIDPSFAAPFNNHNSREIPKTQSTSTGNPIFDRKFGLNATSTPSNPNSNNINNRSATRPIPVPKTTNLPRLNLASDLIATAERLASNSGTSALYSFFGLNPTAPLNPSCCSSPSHPLFPPNLVNPLAALLLQHSRSLQSDQTTPNLSTILNYPSQLGYTVNPNLLTNPSSLFPSNIGDTSQSNSVPPTTVPSGTTTNYISKFAPTLSNCTPGNTNACTSSQLPISESSANVLSSDLFGNFNLGDAQNFSKQPAKSNTEISSNGTASSFPSFSSSNPTSGIDLLPYLSSQSAAQSLRHFAKDLFLGSLTIKNPDLLESNNSSVNLSSNSCFASNKPNPNSLRPSILESTIEPTRNSNNTHQPNHGVEINLLQNSLTMSSHVQGLINFINRSPSPFHAIHTARAILTAHGFRELKEEDVWNIRPMDRVFVTKNDSTVLAAAIGGKFELGGGFSLLGAHTDSPCLRLKPNSERIKENYVQLGVETYGGGLWYTWFDRELTVAGRVIVRNFKGKLEQRLVHIERPLACVPSLAIHLNQEVKTQGFQPNHEQHLCPVLCTSIIEQLSCSENSLQNTSSSSTSNLPNAHASPNPTAPTKHRHPTALIRLLSQELEVPDQDIIELELCLVDFQPAQIGGVFNEFIHAPRLDNLFNSYAGLQGLVESLPTLDSDPNVRLLCLYDHEEVGSTSTQGANSTYTMTTMRRIAAALHRSLATSPDTDLHFEQSLAKSFLISADQAHAVHPSWNERHEIGHRPQLHGGLVLKYNATQRYATNGLTAALVREVAHLANVPLQEFVARQDMGCGSTIGPMLSSQLGVPTVDVGFAQLAMHSCREMCCSTSVGQAVRFYTSYFDHVSHIWPSLKYMDSPSKNTSQSDTTQS